MAINARNKGKAGEREVALLLNAVVNQTLRELGKPIPAEPIIQRNQNQSAVGGADLVGCFGMSVEVKRCETLNIPKWWEQCLKSAKRNNELPVLIFRQNREKWRVMTYATLSLHDGAQRQVRAEISWETFLNFFREWVELQLNDKAS